MSTLERRFEVIRLNFLTPDDSKSSPKKAFEKYFFMLKNYTEFASTMEPFSIQIYGPEWFKRTFTSISHGSQIETLDVLVEFFKPIVLSTRMSTVKASFRLVAYHPNLVARQFGFSQFLPKSPFPKEDEIYLATDMPIEAYYKVFSLSRQKVINLNPFKFKTSFH